MRRLGFFLLANVMGLVTISIIANLLGIVSYLDSLGLAPHVQLTLCGVWGVSVSLISLLLSKELVKRRLNVKVLEPGEVGEFEWLSTTVRTLSRRAGLSQTPEIVVFRSAEVNAFATGASRNCALLAVSSGFLRNTKPEEAEGILAHEVAHIRNGDMVTMTLIHGVLNAFTLFTGRFIAPSPARGSGNSHQSSAKGLAGVFLEILYGLFGKFVLCWFSRNREFRADKESAHILRSDRKILFALRALKARNSAVVPPEHTCLEAFKISGRSPFCLRLLSTHPTLDDRISCLVNGRNASRYLRRVVPA